MLHFLSPLEGVSLSCPVSGGGGDADWCHLDDIPHAHGEVAAAKQTLALFPIYIM